MVDMFELVLPERVSEEVVRKHVKLTYDPSTDELIQIVVFPAVGNHEVWDDSLALEQARLVT